MATQVKKNNTAVKTAPKIKEEETLNNNIKEETKEIETRDIEIARLEEENKAKDAKIDELSRNFAGLQAQIELLMRSGFTPSKPVEEEDILVKCRAIYGAVLATNDGKLVFNFGCEEEKYINSEDLKVVLKESGRDNKKLFENDVLYFDDEENYTKFKIKKRVDMSRENIIKIITMEDPVEMIDEVNKLTNNLVNFSITHSFQFEVVKLLIDKSNPLKNWKYENRVKLENYIGQKWDDLMAAVGAVELLGRKKFN